MRGEFLPVTKQGGEGVKMGRKPSKTAGLIAANSTQKSMSNAPKIDVECLLKAVSTAA